MSGRVTLISLADLAAAGVRLTAGEAAALVRDLALRVERGELPGIPSAHVIRLSADGSIHVEGPVASGREIGRAARLLETLLPGFEAPPELRVPGALRLVIARALGILDLPPYESLEAFADALARFAAPDARHAIRDAFAGWHAAVARKESGAGIDAEVIDVDTRAAADDATGPGGSESELTISDIRRARRATRLTLREISERSRIPVDLLRELEWGYFANWPSGFYGRTQVVRYARAAGLDEKVVLRVVLPMLTGSKDALTPTVLTFVDEALPVVETSLVKTEPHPLVAPVSRTRRRAAWAAALVIPALIAIGLVPAIWEADESVAPASDVVAAPEQQASPPVAAAPETKAALPDAAFSPAFATVGSAMFYHSGMGDRSAIVRAETDPQGAVLRVTRIVSDDASNFHARPSPDGARIAFDSDRDGVRGVYVADADGRNVRRVSGEGFAAVPSWSPDGGRLAFVRAEPKRPRVWNIWILELESGSTERVTAHAVGQPWGAAWFPDGERIAYSHEQRLVIRTLDGSHESTFNSPIPGRLVRTPAVSPDGRRIVFQVHRDGAWILDVKSGRTQKVLADPTAEEFTWSPDGSRIAYHSRRSGKWGIRVISGAAPDAD